MAELTTANIDQLQEERIARAALDAKMFALRHAIECLQPNTQTLRLDYLGMLTALQTAITAELAQLDAAPRVPEEGATDGPQ
jgi:hypothetical protein